MNGLIDVATDIGDTNFSKLSVEQNKKIIDALDMIILVNENANELWKLVDAGVMREDSVVTAVDSISTTITTLVRPTPTALETIAGTPSTVTSLTIGEISYRLPSAKSGWCLVDTFSEEDRESHSLRSNCQSTTDPRSSIEITHLLTDQKSTQNAINSYVQTLKDFGFEIDYFRFMEPFNSSVGPVEIAMLDITDKQTNNTAYVVLGSFIVSEKYYIIRGLHDGTQEGLDFLVDSMFSILDSMEITNKSSLQIHQKRDNDVLCFL